MSDSYEAAAAAYDLFTQDYVPAQLAAIDEVVERFDCAHGPILDIGCGSGCCAAHLLNALPTSTLVCVEPSQSMRALAMARLSADLAWRRRVTIRPEGALEAPLPEQIAGAVMLGVFGHFDADEQIRLMRRLSRRLPHGGIVLFDLQPPATPCKVAPYTFADVQVGDLRYEGIAEGEPAGGDAMRWTMRYRTYEDDRIIEERCCVHLFRHPDPALVAEQLSQVGFDLHTAHSEGFWVATSNF